MPPPRQASQLRHGIDPEVGQLGDPGPVAVLRRGRKRRFLRGVDDDVGAHDGGQLAADRGDLAGDDGADPGGSEHAHHGEPDRTAADHDRDPTLRDLAATHRVQGNGHRLSERGQAWVQPVGDGEHQRLLHQHPLGVPTRRVCRQADQVYLAAAAQHRHRDYQPTGRHPAAGARPIRRYPVNS
jgi:hypothetical protein